MNELDIEFKIDVDFMGIHKELDGRKNVVYEIRSFLVAEHNGQVEREIIVTPLGDVSADNFVEFENLTKEIVHGWVYAYSGSAVENLKKKLIECFLPKTEYVKPPFSIGS